MRPTILPGLLLTALLFTTMNAVAASSGELIADQIERETTASVGPGATGARVIRAQILLGRAGFSPGEIDGRYGDDLIIAIKGYQEKHELKPTGVVDLETWKLLDENTVPLLASYTITAVDTKGPFVPIPKDVAERAQMKWLGYESPEEGLGEKFHMSPKLLAELNPGKHLDTAVEQIVVAKLTPLPARRALRVVVSKSKRTVTAYGARDKLLAQYPATMGGPHDPLPLGTWKILTIVHYPWFNWDPVHFWNVSPAKGTHRLAPGPNNPAGAVWVGLSKANYGIHGTPEPGQVRHGESYGCIRMTNWDVIELSHMVVRGTPAILEE